MGEGEAGVGVRRYGEKERVSSAKESGDSQRVVGSS